MDSSLQGHQKGSSNLSMILNENALNPMGTSTPIQNAGQNKEQENKRSSFMRWKNYSTSHIIED